MEKLVLEVNRTTIAERFKVLITDSMKTLYGDDDDRTLQWINTGSSQFMAACKLSSPREPVDVTADAPGSLLAQFVDKWESVDTWRQDETDEWKPMTQESINIKATMLRDIREIINGKPHAATSSGT